MEINFLGEKVVETSPHESILASALKAGIPHFHACGGKAKCSTCRILVISGEENLSKPNRKEIKLKDAVHLPPTVRLACQTFVLREPVTVDRIIKDQGQIAEFLFPDPDRPGEYKVEPLGEEKYLVLFFVDLRNFTQFIEKYLPFDIVYVMRNLFEIFTRVIKSFGGHVVETAGDQLFAVFGCENSIRESCDAAINAGREILDQLKGFNQLYSEVYLNERFSVGMGVHAAKVIMAKFSIAGEVKTSVMGLGVNIASRLQDATKELNNSFLASAEVVRQSSDAGKYETKIIRLRGLSSPLAVHLIGSPYDKGNTSQS